MDYSITQVVIDYLMGQASQALQSVSRRKARVSLLLCLGHNSTYSVHRALFKNSTEEKSYVDAYEYCLFSG